MRPGIVEDTPSAARDPYVLANVIGFAAALSVHAALALGVLSSPVYGLALFPPTLVCFGATMGTHPEARVKRVGWIVVGASMDLSSIWRTAPKWALAVTAALLAYIAWFAFRVRTDMVADAQPRQFVALFSAVCAHLLWAGVGIRLGALRLARASA